MSKTIEIIVSPKGFSRVETKGFNGAECREASQFLEKALGKIMAEKLTSEFHQAVQNQHSNHVRD